MRPIDADQLKKAILEERDKIPLEVIERYSFGVPTAFLHGQSMRGGIRKALRCMEETPTLDVEPVRHGRWICQDYDFWDYWKCSACNGEFSFEYDPSQICHYCHNCGAKMDAKEE